ncbi:MAG: hypothetical protein CMI66_05620 [Pedosphaera sp.]|nr:hypothetical protein [Pedosphaera sp.]|tara:strand:+ start:143 stop:409 length:267 start_codon:yes stop_codon:yes gene_type:complete
METEAYLIYLILRFSVQNSPKKPFSLGVCVAKLFRAISECATPAKQRRADGISLKLSRSLENSIRFDLPAIDDCVIFGKSSIPSIVNT